MLRRNSEIKITHTASVVLKFDNKEISRAVFKKEDLEKLGQGLEQITDDLKRTEAMLALECLMSGKKIVLKEDTIYLFTGQNVHGKISANWIITENPELYEELFSLLEKTVLS